MIRGGGDTPGLAARSRGLVWSLPAWLAVWAFWLAATRHAHPTTGLALVVTTALTVAYAAECTLNGFVLVPRYWRVGRFPAYAGALVASMSVLTALALGVVRLAYQRTMGPDPDPNGLARHFAIDFAGMAAHVLAAAGVTRVFGRLSR